MPDTDVASKLFRNFRELYGLFSRHTAHEAERRQDELNRKRNVRVFDGGNRISEEADVRQASETPDG